MPLRQSENIRHAFASAHAAQFGPPQSVSVSVPFATASLHVASRQAALTQTWLSQSLATVQPEAAPQVGQLLPPQSTPVSSPFSRPSEHSAVRQVPFSQIAVVQSVAAAQAF